MVKKIFNFCLKTSISESWKNPYETYNVNTKALHIALEYCLKFKIN